MKVAPIKVKTISFGEGNLNNINSQVGLLSIQNSDKLNFEKNLKLTQAADAVQSNPIKALVNKVKKAYNIVFSTYTKDYENKHIAYIA